MVLREDTMKDKTHNKLNTPYRTNVEYAKKRTNNRNNHQSGYESRYDYEFGNEVNNSAKDSPLARGANIADAFSYPGAPNDEEFASENEVTARKLKQKYQENLRQNYNIEFSDDEEICDNCQHCKK